MPCPHYERREPRAPDLYPADKGGKEFLKGAMQLEITVKIKVPDGPTCYYENGLVCGWGMKHTGAEQSVRSV